MTLDTRGDMTFPHLTTLTHMLADLADAAPQATSRVPDVYHRTTTKAGAETALIVLPTTTNVDADDDDGVGVCRPAIAPR